ncbi:MAG TPA: protein kinase [Bryobacteraceae bacterium]|nr:protein kinase [Bryobacteraceae bacterium]
MFLKALELPVDQRASYLNGADVSVEVREEVLAMLREDNGAETFIQATVDQALPAETGIGQRFGAFETRAVLGRGGMGVVFLAGRSDGELAQTVAIKVIERGWLASRALERFRVERQLLAGLTHPGIARLIDGGTRQDGVPYLVMEYVDGQPIDRYCAERKLSLRERLKLFLPLCDAVDYAHRKLIVHRDLKPSNVLVTASGDAKLLDFGVAKTLETDGGQTQTMIFTPDFASPEQARGEVATTATDIYGLGGVLYHLLTGQTPHATEALSPTAAQRMICEQEPRRPSAWNAVLQGDLDNILLKALHLDAQRRYGSVREFAQDIENYLADRPVRATPDRWSYRAGRFLRRNTIASMATGLALAAIAGGTGFSLYEARQAQKQAEDVRALSNRFIFDFNDAIMNTPGTLAAQKMVVSTAREYLAKLAADASRDRAVDRDLAQSYYRLSGIEKRLGDAVAATAHVKDSLSILEVSGDGCCGPAAQRTLYIEDLIALSVLKQEGAALSESLQVTAQAVEAGRRWTRSEPAEPKAQNALMRALWRQGAVLEASGKHPEAKKVLEEAMVIADALYRERPKDAIAAADAADSRKFLATTLQQVGEITAGLARVREGEAILDGLIAGAPENREWRYSRILLTSLRSVLLTNQVKGDPALMGEAVAAQREAATMAQATAAANPRDLVVLDQAVVMTARLANRLKDIDHVDESLAVERQSLALIDQMLAVDPNNRRFLYLRANGCMIAGSILMKAERWREAREVLTEGEGFVKRSLAKDPEDVGVMQSGNILLICLTRTERNLGNMERARERCREAMVSSEKLIRMNKNAREPVAMIDILHSEAKLLGVLDTTLKQE